MNKVIQRIAPLIGIIGMFANSIAGADPGGHPLSMWQVDGQRNHVYLLGSIHLLRERDHPLSQAIYDAYDESEALYMELDMDDADPIADQILANELGLIQSDDTLQDLLGPNLYAQAAALAASAQIPLQLLDKAKPWYAAIQVELIMLLRIGFNPLYGVESHLSARAVADNKEIYGLETIRQQLEFLDGLSKESQREMFMQTLAESSELANMMETVVDAWHKGDTAFLEDNLLADMQDYPELNKTIVIDRNHAWTSKIEELLTQDDDFLVVVGALHLIGQDGVPELLQKRGFEVKQMRQSVN